jgi:hypothetical protein
MTQRPVLLNSKRDKSYEQGRSWGWANVSAPLSKRQSQRSAEMIDGINILNDKN